MSSHDHARLMSVDELLQTLQTICGPLLTELARRDFNVRLDNRQSASGVPIFTATPKPKLVAE